MKITDAKIGTRVVRAKGDYVVGRVGVIVEIDETKNRARVDWDTAAMSQVNFNALEPEAIPYRIEPGFDRRDMRGNWVGYTYAKYHKL